MQTNGDKPMSTQRWILPPIIPGGNYTVATLLLHEEFVTNNHKNKIFKDTMYDA